MIVEETDPLDVPLMVAKGYSSKSYAYGAARDIAGEMERLKRIYIYHLGDSDPSGEDAARDVEAKLRRYTQKLAGEDVEIHFKRIAVLDEQIERWNLPLRPNQTGRQSDQEIPSSGGSVELDAIPAHDFARSSAMLSSRISITTCIRPKGTQDGEQKYLRQWPELFRQGHG